MGVSYFCLDKNCNYLKCKIISFGMGVIGVCRIILHEYCVAETTEITNRTSDVIINSTFATIEFSTETEDPRLHNVECGFRILFDIIGMYRNTSHTCSMTPKK